jgi:ABC-type glutathione transport system ATPase component
MNQSGTTVIMVSHNLEALSEYTKGLLVLEQGRLVDWGATREVFVRLKQGKNGDFRPTEAQRIAALLADRKVVLSPTIVTFADLFSALKQELAGGGTR